MSPQIQKATVRCPDGYVIPVVTDVEMNWYSEQWRAAREPSIYLPVRHDAAKRIYRFTWLRTFHGPMFFRVEDHGDLGSRFIAKELNGAGGFGPGRIVRTVDRTLAPNEAQRVREAMGAHDLRSLAPAGCQTGSDGSRWIIEMSEAGDYRYINRWTPKDGPVRQTGLMFLEMTGWPVARIY